MAKATARLHRILDKLDLVGQLDLLDLLDKPETPDTPDRARLRNMVLAELRKTPRGLTADEIAQQLSESILNVRPRVSELVTSGHVVETSERRKNRSGKRAIVWRVRGEMP